MGLGRSDSSCIGSVLGVEVHMGKWKLTFGEIRLTYRASAILARSW